MAKGNVTKRILALPKHIILAGKNVFREGMRTTSSVVGRTVNGVVHMGNTTAKHVNMGIDETFGKKPTKKTRRAIKKSKNVTRNARNARK